MAIPIAYRFPIYLRHNTKVYVATIPLFLAGIVLPPPVAALFVGAGVTAGEWLSGRAKGSTRSDIARHAARLMAVGFAGSVVAHAPPTSLGVTGHVLAVVCSAAVWWLGDFLTLPIAVCPITRETPIAVFQASVRAGGVIEAGQYLVGIVAGVVMLPHPWTAALLGGPAVLIYLLARKEVDPETYELLESMADAVDLRDPFTVGHSRRVEEVTRAILQELGRRGQEADFICLAARLHDIGKVSIPDQILLKRSRLTVEERQIMQRHPQSGAQILSEYPDLTPIVEMVRHHHEWWDGHGQPNGYHGTEIPFGARVLRVADGFVSLTSDRSYRRALSIQQAAETLRNGAGREWDPDIVLALLRTLGESPRAQHAEPRTAPERESADLLLEAVRS